MRSVAVGLVGVSAAVVTLLACSQDASIAPSSFGGGKIPNPASVPTSPLVTADLSRCPGIEPPVVGSVCGEVGPPTGAFGTSSGFRFFDASISPSSVCEYGHDLDRRCNAIFTCSGVWTVQSRASCADRCPASFDDIVPGEPCTDPSMGCSYVQGTCACVASLGDGGERSSRWVCVAPPGNGCPAQRPALGSDCVEEMTCDYGSCALQRDVTFACARMSGWVQANTQGCKP